MEVSLKERESRRKIPLPLYLPSHLPACGVDIVVGISMSILNHELTIERSSKKKSGSLISSEIYQICLPPGFF